MPAFSYLGPEGSFTHQALEYLTSQVQNKTNYELKDIQLIAHKTIASSIEAVSNHETNYALVPVENSLAGTVGETADYLFKHPNLFINHEIVLDIKHCLLAKNEDLNLTDISKLFSHSMSFGQCQNFLHKNCHNADLEVSPSNSYAAKILAKSKDKTAAAISTEFAAKLYKLKVIKSNINDNPRNQTRFWLISRNSKSLTETNKTKSSMIFQIDDKPGSLYQVLKAFSEAKINLSRIESRPAKDDLGKYIFCIDCENITKEDTSYEEVMKNIGLFLNYYRWLGSYSLII